jgi:beta-galactosidase
MTPRVDAVTAFAAATSGLGVVAAVPPSVGLIVSRRSALHAFATDRTMDLYRDSVLGAYRMLADDDEPVEILHDTRIERSGVPAQVTAVIWPMPATATPQLAAALEKFVGRGGVLVAEAAPGEYDGHGARRAQVPGAGLDALFGARQVDADIAPATEVTFVDSRAFTGAWQREQLKLEGAVPLAFFADRSPAVTRHAVRAGQAILVATYPSLSYHREPTTATRSGFLSLLGSARRPRELTWHDPQPGLISRPVVLTDGRTAVIAVNWSSSDQRASHQPSTQIVVPARTGCAFVRA